jgi:hypothetical protein
MMAPIIRSEVTASTVRLPSAWNSQDSKQTLLYVYDHGLKIAYHGMYVCMMCVGFLFLPLFLSTSLTIFCLLPVSLLLWDFSLFFFFLFCPQFVCVLSSVHVFLTQVFSVESNSLCSWFCLSGGGKKTFE